MILKIWCVNRVVFYTEVVLQQGSHSFTNHHSVNHIYDSKSLDVLIRSAVLDKNNKQYWARVVFYTEVVFQQGSSSFTNHLSVNHLYELWQV